MQRPARINSEERLTILAAVLILGLAAAWCVVAWQYLARQRAELDRARAGAITLAQSAAQDFIRASEDRRIRADVDGSPRDARGLVGARWGAGTSADYPELARDAFRPATDSTLKRLLPLHAGRDTVMRFSVRTIAGVPLFAPNGAEAATPSAHMPSFAWSDSSAAMVPRQGQPATFMSPRHGGTVLLERPFWTVTHPSLVLTVSIDVPALLYGIPGTPPPIPAGAVWASMFAVALLGGGGLFALHRARQLMRARTLFFSGVSHELRTPLTQVLMYGESLQGGLLSTEQRDRAQHVIVRETRRLVHMIENVLLLARGGARHIPLNPVAADVGEVVVDTLQSLQLLLDRHRTNLILTREPLTAWIDVGATRQVIVNLVDNALRYGPAGQTLRISVQQHGPGVLLTVQDEGPGIPPPDRQRVFLPFEKGTSTDSANGTGLGLALVRQLMDAMRGWVRINDTPDRGLSISVWFPQAEPHPSAPGAPLA